LALCFFCNPIHAEHAVIDLRVISPAGSAKAASDQEPPVGGVNPRPRLKVKAGDPLVLNFVLINAYPHGRLKDVIVHYSVTHIAKSTAKAGPDKDAVLFGEVTLNFKPKSRVGSRIKFHLDQPGLYLVRIETQNTKSDHEHFSAIEVDVQ